MAVGATVTGTRAVVVAAAETAHHERESAATTGQQRGADRFPDRV
jgi:hypothetical protein